MQLERSSGSMQYGVGSWRSHTTGMSNHLGEDDSCWGGKVSGSQRHDPRLGLTKARPRWPSHLVRVRSCRDFRRPVSEDQKKVLKACGRGIRVSRCKLFWDQEKARSSKILDAGYMKAISTKGVVG